MANSVWWGGVALRLGRCCWRVFFVSWALYSPMRPVGHMHMFDALLVTCLDLPWPGDIGCRFGAPMQPLPWPVWGTWGVFFPVLASNALASAMSGVGLIVIFTAINSAEIRKVAAVQSLTTVLKVLPLLALGILGLAHLNLEHLWHEGTYKGGVLSGITSATTFTLFAFLGVESAAISSARIRHPARNMGRASLLGTLLTVLVYLLGTLAVMGVVPPEVLMESEAPFADAGRGPCGGVKPEL